MLVHEMCILSDGATLIFCIRKSAGRPGLNCVFTDDGQSCMIEATDIKKLEMILTFIGAL